MLRTFLYGFLVGAFCIPFISFADSALVISSVNISHSGGDVTLSWSTNQETNTTIQYGRTSEYGMSVSSDSKGLDHTQTISGLGSDTVYHFRIVSKDSSGNETSTSDISVMTGDANARDGSSSGGVSGAGVPPTKGGSSGTGGGTTAAGATGASVADAKASGSNGLSGVQIVQCGGTGQPDCDYNQIVKIINNIMKILLYLIPGVGTVVLMWAGFMFMTSGDNPGRRSLAKRALLNIGIGIVVMLGAWLIVYTLMTKLMPEGSEFLKTGGKTQTVEEVIQLKK